MAELNVQEAIEALRSEVQSGFDRVLLKFDEHIKSDTEQFSAIEQRITAVEAKEGLVLGGIGATMLALIGSLFGWAFSSR